MKVIFEPIQLWSTNIKSVSRKNVLKSRLSGDGNFVEFGWQIFRDKWTDNETRSIVQSIIGRINKAKLSSTETCIELHNCKTIRAYPGEYFPEKKRIHFVLKQNWH